MDIETLYPLVTEAIRKAEVYEDIGAPGAMDAHRDVSLLEERVAKLLSASNVEGAVARRGPCRRRGARLRQGSDAGRAVLWRS
jgi:hypothetical protein